MYTHFRTSFRASFLLSPVSPEHAAYSTQLDGLAVSGAQLIATDHDVENAGPMIGSRGYKLCSFPGPNFGPTTDK